MIHGPQEEKLEDPVKFPEPAFTSVLISGWFDDVLQLGLPHLLDLDLPEFPFFFFPDTGQLTVFHALLF